MEGRKGGCIDGSRKDEETAVGRRKCFYRGLCSRKSGRKGLQQQGREDYLP